MQELLEIRYRIGTRKTHNLLVASYFLENNELEQLEPWFMALWKPKAEERELPLINAETGEQMGTCKVACIEHNIPPKKDEPNFVVKFMTECPIKKSLIRAVQRGAVGFNFVGEQSCNSSAVLDISQVLIVNLKRIEQGIE